LLDAIRSIDICDVWLKCGGPEFKKSNGEFRTINIIRGETNPSLTYIKKYNILYDNAEYWMNKNGRAYRHTDIVIAFKLAKSEREALVWLINEFDLDIDASEINQKRIDHSQKMYKFHAMCVDNLGNHINTKTMSDELTEFFDDRKWIKDEQFYRDIGVGLLPESKVVSKMLQRFPLIREKDYNDIHANNVLVFPLYDSSHNLINFLLRIIVKKDFRLTSYSKKVRGFFHILGYANNTNVSIIVEGEGNAVALAMAHWKAKADVGAIFSLGSSQPKGSDLIGLGEQLSKSGMDSVIVMSDNDEAGRGMVDKIYRYVSMDVDVLDWPQGTPTKYDPEDQLKDLDFDISDFKSFTDTCIRNYVDFMFRTHLKTINHPNKDKKYHKIFNTALKIGSGLRNERDKRKWAVLVEGLIEEDIFYRIDRPPGLKHHAITAKNNKMFRTTTTPDGGEITNEISNFVCEIIEERANLNLQKNKIERALLIKTVAANGKRMSDVIMPVDVMTDSKNYYNHLLHHIGIELWLKQDELRKQEWVEFIQGTSVPRKIMVTPYLGMQDPDIMPLPPKINSGETIIASNGYSVVSGELLKNESIDIRTDNPLFDNFMKNYQFGPSEIEEQIEIAQTIIEKVRNVHNPPLVDAVFGFLLASPIKYMFKDIPGMNVGSGGLSMILHGKSGIGKTATLALGMALFGKFRADNLPAFRATDAHREYMLSKVGSLPISIDEYRASAKVGYDDINNLILDIYNGTSKGRMNINMGAQARARIKTHAVFTTEFLPEGHEGENARFIDIGFTVFDKFGEPGYGEDVLDNYSEWMANKAWKLTSAWLCWITKNPEILVQETSMILDLFYTQMKSEKNGHRISCNAAQCVAAYRTYMMYIVLIGGCTQEVADEILDSNMKYWKINLIQQASRISQSSTADKIIEYIKTILLFETARNVAVFRLSNEDKMLGNWEMNKNHEMLLTDTYIEQSNGEWERGIVFDPGKIARNMTRNKISDAMTRSIIIKELSAIDYVRNPGMEIVKVFWPGSKRPVKRRIMYIPKRRITND